MMLLIYGDCCNIFGVQNFSMITVSHIMLAISALSSFLARLYKVQVELL